MEKTDLSIIYVNFNSTDLLLKSIGSVKEHAPGFSYEIIIVDNDSKETELDELTSVLSSHCEKPALPRHCEESSTTQSISLKDCHGRLGRPRNDELIQIIKNSENTGFGAANNLGTKKAGGQYLLFLNPDTLIVDDTISKMTGFLKNHPEIGALSPLLKNSDGRLQKHFYADNSSLYNVTIGRRKKSQIDLKKPYFSVGMVSGAAMMVKAELFQKIGGFDENFFMYQEDEDLCLRFRKAGYKNAVLTSAEIIHIEGRSSIGQDKKKWYYQSQNYYFRKHYGWLTMMVMRALRLPYLLYQRRGQ